jgi:hypothetical protein
LAAFANSEQQKEVPMNNVALSLALATNPSIAFEELRARPRFWFPLLVVIAATIAVVFWYYSVVDIEWLKDAMYGNHPDFQKMTEAERAKALGVLSRNTLRLGSVISIAVVLPLVFLVLALYLWLAAKVTGLSQGFRHWFALNCWTALPMLLSTVVSAVLLLLSDTPQVSPSVLQPLSLNELLLHRPAGSPGHTLISSLNIPSILSWILMIIGVRTWSQRSWTFSTAFILLPGVVIYGIWAFFAFR